MVDLFIDISVFVCLFVYTGIQTVVSGIENTKQMTKTNEMIKFNEVKMIKYVRWSFKNSWIKYSQINLRWFHTQ